MKRDPKDTARAVRRVRTESPVPLADLADLAGASAATLERWIVQGKQGVHLDGFRHRDGYWVSSEAAVVRFLAEAARNEEWLAEVRATAAA